MIQSPVGRQPFEAVNIPNSRLPVPRFLQIPTDQTYRKLYLCLGLGEYVCRPNTFFQVK